MREKIKNFFRWIWRECKDWHTVVLLLCVIAVMYSPVWGGYLLHAAFGWSWCSAVASAYLIFWAGPFTPFFPICIGVTLSIKKAIELRKKKRDHCPPAASDADGGSDHHANEKIKSFQNRKIKKCRKDQDGAKDNSCISQEQ